MAQLGCTTPRHCCSIELDHVRGFVIVMEVPVVVLVLDVKEEHEEVVPQAPH